MSEGVFIRYFCHVTSYPGESKLGDLSYEYFSGDFEATFDSRVIPVNIASINSRRVECNLCTELDEPDSECSNCSGKGYKIVRSRWSGYDDAFTRPVPKSYLNLVCGDYSETERLFTVGVKNVAIVSTGEGSPSEKESLALMQYDSVICPHGSDAEVLRILGIERAIHIAPISIASFLRKII